ncbi:MAG: hypothetical protein GX640_05115 [Fibrobacter sp.]|nr:hypothetical protein [Fibrobacter sp.]
MKKKNTSSSSSSSIVKGIVLLVFLIVLFVITSKLKKNGFSSHLTNLVNTDFSIDMKKIKELGEAEKEAQKKIFAGFWVYQTQDQEASVQKSDHIELKDNGIIWQVINWFITLPSGDTVSIYHTRQAYLNPYGKITDNLFSCEARIIRQVYIIGTDTCYGNSQVDEIWTAEMGKNGLVLNNRVYNKYDGETEEFFPEGMIDQVDRLLLKSCKTGAGMTFYAKNIIKDKLNASQPVIFNAQSMREWVQQYYNPIVVEEMLCSPNLGVVPDSLRIEFSVATDGSVFALKSKGRLLEENRFEKKLIQEIQTWVFPKPEPGAQKTDVSHTFKFSR